MTDDVILTTEGLTKEFAGFVAVNDVSFAVKRGTIHALIGPNGAGKTTVFNCITGFYRPTSGALQLKHDDGHTIRLERLNDFRISKQAKVARTFQNIRLFPGMTALENLMVAQHNALIRASGLTFLGLIGVMWLELSGKGSPVLPVALLIVGSNGIIAILLPYAAESFPLRVRGRATGWVAACTKGGGVLAQVLSITALVPAMGVAAGLIMAPIVLALGLVAWFGRETRGGDLRRLDDAMDEPLV